VSGGFEPELAAEPEEGSPSWMTSFCDMIMLMLCFFVLLLSFAKTDDSTFHSALGSVRQALGGPEPFSNEAAPRGAPSAPTESERKAAPLATAAFARQKAQEEARLARFREYLDARGLAAQVEVSASPRGIVLRTRDRVLFESAEAHLKPDGTAVLDAVRGLCRELEARLTVEGHSDDRPIQSTLFPSNWELSGARASAVLRYLVANGVDPERVHVAGYADTHPVASNATEEGRAQNRRVEFVFAYDQAATPE
jgi:chemotaxis protein MotB